MEMCTKRFKIDRVNAPAICFTTLVIYSPRCDTHCAYVAHGDFNHPTEKREEKLQTSVPCLCYCFLVEYLALAGLMNFLAQLSDKIHHFTVYNLMPLAFLTKLSKMH